MRSPASTADPWLNGVSVSNWPVFVAVLDRLHALDALLISDDLVSVVEIQRGVERTSSLPPVSSFLMSFLSTMARSIISFHTVDSSQGSTL